MKIQEKYMDRCLQLARSGLGTTYPNPLVGAVVVHNDRIIAEGWHKKAGGPHAEVIAIEAVKNPSLLKESILYVNLEPCSHHGRTPPCADLILEYGIPHVVVGSLDPNPQVAGRGIARLRDRGVEVEVGILKQECDLLNKRFFTFHKYKRPYIILKWAESADGFLSPATKPNARSFSISNAYSRQLVHRMRAREMGILVGANTLRQDDPELNVRHWHGEDPYPIVLSRSGSIPSHFRLNDGEKEVLLFGGHSTHVSANVTVVDNGPFSIHRILGELYKRGIQSVMVEGGEQVLSQFIESGHWDEAWIFRSADIFLSEGTPAPTLPKRQGRTVDIMGDQLRVISNISA